MSEVTKHVRGAGLPPSLYMFVGEMLATANFTWTMFPGLSQGAFNTIALHGSPELKDKYLPKLVTGEWTGTMCLTEPHCGSDLAQVSTKATPQADGTYAITGTKIFISCGEHDMVDNIVHCVLARLPDAPPGINTHFTCFTGTMVLILTQLTRRAGRHQGHLPIRRPQTKSGRRYSVYLLYSYKSTKNWQEEGLADWSLADDFNGANSGRLDLLVLLVQKYKY